MSRITDTIHFKNKQTGKHETITQHDLTIKDWGFSFLVETEMEAYKAAYQYRDNPFGTMIDFAPGSGLWMVTVFNALGAKMGLDGSRKVA